MNITTNNKAREILSFFDLTEKEQDSIKDNYDSIKESAFFRYRGDLYDLNDFMCNNQNSSLPSEWDGYCSDSFFSAVLVKYLECGEELIVGIAIS
jgi:hypothetical protein